MSHRVDPDGALRLVEARLGRPPQDELEAAVVLEAWGGLRGDTALSLGRKARSGIKAVGGRARRAGRSPAPDHAVLSEGLALVIAVLALATWALPMARELGPLVWQHALTLALPVSFALQWGVRTRYLSRDGWLGLLQEDALACLLLLAAAMAGLAQAGRAGIVAALLVAVWTLGSLLVRRGWGLWYGGSLAVAAGALEAGAEPVALLSAMSAIALAAVIAAVRFPPRMATAKGSPSRPAPWRDALLAALAGGGIGVLLVADDTVGWGVHGALPALALLPSTVGSLWGGFRLWRLPVALSRSLQALTAQRADSRALAAESVAVVAGAIARFVVVTAALSLAVVYAGRWTSGTSEISLLVAFGCVTLGSMAVGLLSSVRGSGWAILVVAAALVAEGGCATINPGGAAGQGLIVGGLVCSMLAFPPVIASLGRPGRTLATAVWIR